MAEHPDFRCTLVDVSAPAGGNGQAYSPREVRNLVEGFFSDDPEEEVLLRGADRSVNRLMPAALDVPTVSSRSLGANESYRLEILRPGDLDTLTLRKVPRSQPGPREVGIEVHAAALNFRDIVYAMGLLTGKAVEKGYGQGVTLGMEFSGRVVALGEGVDRFRVGDEVIALGRHCFSPYATTTVDAVVAKPAGLGFEVAATLPATFVTAYHGLCHLTQLQPGERLLIHAGAGGVGLAALQLARRAGAEVFATAGSDEKRDFLRALGIRHVMDSRSLAFADEIREATGGEGVDVVLNSIGGEAIARSLGLLKRFGRYLEIGKRDLVQNSRLGLRPFERCLSFHAIDVDQMLQHAPALFQRLFREVIEVVARGELRPLPHRVFPIDRVADAYRCMQQSRHIGKLIVSVKGRAAQVQDEGRARTHFRGDATYLVTGGLGGLGLALARWLVRNGARSLVLAGRRGADTPEAAAVVDDLRAAGAEVVVAKMDVADPAQVGRVLDHIQRSMPPLRGVFHGALVLDDGIVLHQNRERLLKVMGPKMHGAWNLHSQTLGLPLDHFVLFSSAMSMLGNPGQANYGAGSGFLDMLAHYRHGKGLPALVINWGGLAEAGYVARHADVGQRFARRGVHNMPLAEALETLGRLMATDRAQAGVMRIDWPKWNPHAAARAGKLSTLIAKAVPGAEPENGAADSPLAGIATLLPAERRQLVESRLCDQVARVLGTSGARMVLDKSITLQGLDSLMAVDLRVRIERDFGVDVPVMQLMQGPSVAELAAQVTERLGPKPGPEHAAGLAEAGPAPAPVTAGAG
jgi:NADPH:quinone reductase-like Zn-dependent oxidoreductase/acyl carrier protein